MSFFVFFRMASAAIGVCFWGRHTRLGATQLMQRLFWSPSRWGGADCGARSSAAERSLRQPGEHLLQSDGDPPAEVPRRYRLPGLRQDRLCLSTSPTSCAAGATAGNPCPTWRGLPPVLRRGVEQHQFGRSSGRRLRRQCNAHPPGGTTESTGVRLLCSLQEHDRYARKTRQDLCMRAVRACPRLSCPRLALGLISLSRAHIALLGSSALLPPWLPHGCTAGCTGYTWDSNDGGWCYLKHVPKCNSTRPSPGQYTASATLKVAPTGVPLDGFVPGKCIYQHT